MTSAQQPLPISTNETRITDQDLQRLLAENPLASEQIRRMAVEREKAALLKELDDLKNIPPCKCQLESENGTVKNVEAVLADN
jgi:hypothetical protein